MKERDHQSTRLRRGSVGIQPMMINELGCCNAGVVWAYCAGEGHRIAVPEKAGKQSSEHKMFCREVEHCNNWLRAKSLRMCYRKELTGNHRLQGKRAKPSSYIGFWSQSCGLCGVYLL